MTFAQQLEDELTRLKLFPAEGLNLLNELGIISDLCVTLEDVAEADAEFAVTILKAMNTTEVPTYTEAQLASAKAISDDLRETVEANDAMGIGNDAKLLRQFSAALRQTRFLERRLKDQSQ